MPKTTSKTAPSEVMNTDSLMHKRRHEKLEAEEAELKALEEAALRGDTTGNVVDDEATETDEPETQEEDGEQEVLTKEEETYKKRYGDLRRHMQKKEEEWKAKLEGATNGEGAIRPPKSDEDIEAWAKRYPDLAAIIETVASKKAKDLFSQAESRLQQFDADKDEADRLHASNIIKKAHPDFDKISGDDGFHDWAEAQPKWVQDAVYEQPIDPAGIVRALDLYKLDNNMTTSAQKAKEKAAASSTRRGSSTAPSADGTQKVWKESDVEAMTEAEFAKAEHEIDLAINKGRFIYDISQPQAKRA